MTTKADVNEAYNLYYDYCAKRENIQKDLSVYRDDYVRLNNAENYFGIAYNLSTAAADSSDCIKDTLALLKDDFNDTKLSGLDMNLDFSSLNPDFNFVSTTLGNLKDDIESAMKRIDELQEECGGKINDCIGDLNYLDKCIPSLYDDYLRLLANYNNGR